MHQLKRIVLIVVILISCVGCDQTTKSLARDHLRGSATVSYFGDTLRLQYAENPGGFLSLGASLPHEWASFAFTVGGAVLVVTTLLYAVLASNHGWLQLVALSLVSGGGISNILDRALYQGRVTDFLNMGFGSFRTGIFNMADVALMVGVALFVLRYVPTAQTSGSRGGKPEPRVKS
jgi:signal peptidase II